MADQKAPEPWVDGWRWDGVQFVRVDPQDATMSLGTLREIAALAGLAIVSEADRKVLDECSKLTDDVLHSPLCNAEKLYPLCDEIQRSRRRGT